MDNAIIQALRRAQRAYMENVGEPTAQLVGGGVRGYLGLDAPEYADGRGMEAYRNAAAIGNTPVVGLPSMAVRAGARAAPAMASALREHSKGFQEYNRALGPAGASQAIVWHGSPHKFDRFDSSKIGTGEGAQAYGHGLYLAESPGVAASYRDALSGGQKWNQQTAAIRLTDGSFVNKGDPTYGLYSGILNEATSLGGASSVKDIADASKLQWEMLSARAIPENASAMKKKWAQEAIDAAKAKYEAALRIDVSPSEGQLYKVDLPDSMIARMLDWDKPVSQQGGHDAFKSLPDFARPLDAVEASNVEGARLYQRLAARLGDKTAADVLRKSGIPGIRYLDGSSRATGQGTSNFVVFPGEEGALTILERNNEVINALRKKKQD